MREAVNICAPVGMNAQNLLVTFPETHGCYFQSRKSMIDG
jgi:hypothetical protein